MSQENLKSVQQLIDEQPNLDTTAVFERLRSIQKDMFAKIQQHLELHPDSSSIQQYQSLDGAATGSLNAYSGRQMDWLIYSWVGNPAKSFCNMHLTAWLGPQTEVPHFAFAAGTFPVTFFLIDYLPRKEPILHPEYVRRYMVPANERFMALQADKRLMPFVSQDTFTREAVSQVGLNFIAQPGVDIFDLIEESAHEYLDRWLIWLNEAETVPTEQQAKLAERDLAIRRNIAEGDPANGVVEKMYGVQLTRRLVRGLWGGDRTSIRPGAI